MKIPDAQRPRPELRDPLEPEVALRCSAGGVPGGEVVVEHPDRPVRPERARAEEVAEPLARFQVDAEDRVGGIAVLALQPGDRLELGT